MTQSLALEQLALPDLGRLRLVLELLTQLRDIKDPLTSLDGLRASIALVLKLTELFGVSEEWRKRLAQIFSDENLLLVLLGVLRLLQGMLDTQQENGVLHVKCEQEQVVEVTAASFAEWLPIALQLIQLLRLIRGRL
jgi:hypothetical protein